MNEYAELPWSAEDTIENLKELKDIMKNKVILQNLHGKGEKDAKEVEFDFGRAINALQKRLEEKPYEDGCEEKAHYKCPDCGFIMITIYKDGYRLGNTPKYCERCGKAIDWEGVI